MSTKTSLASEAAKVAHSWRIEIFGKFPYVSQPDGSYTGSEMLGRLEPVRDKVTP